MDRSNTWHIFLAVVLGSLLVACVTRPVDDPPQKQGRQDSKTFPQTIEKDVDILFVIDNSPSMKQEQDNLARQFGVLIEALRSEKLGPDGVSCKDESCCNKNNVAGCAIPNVHIGVITPDLGIGRYSDLIESCRSPQGDQGILQNRALGSEGCTPPSDPWIEYIEGVTNIDGGSSDPVQQVKDAFACIAKVGKEGCGFEQQLEAARRALDPSKNPNPDFLRDDAFLAVVIITDEDDCSARNLDLFDPTNESLGEPNFRCFEYGVNCATPAGANPRDLGPRGNCSPNQNSDYLFRVNDLGDGQPSYENFFKALKPVPGRVILASIAAPKSPVVVEETEVTTPSGETKTVIRVRPSCAKQGLGEGFPAIRIQSLIDSFTTNEGHVEGEFAQICTDDFGPALARIGEKIVGALGRQCVDTPVLTEEGGLACQGGTDLGGGLTCPSPGCLRQADCSIELVIAPGTPQENRQKVEPCSQELFENPSAKPEACNPCPCWRIIDNNTCTPSQDGSPYALQIMKSEDFPKGTSAIARCKTATASWGSSELFSSLDSDGDGTADMICK